MTMSLTRPTRPSPARSIGEAPLSALSKELINKGREPAKVPAQAIDLRQRLHAAAMHVLTTGAPGLTEISRNALASAIALRCERVIQTQEKAA